MNDLFSNRKNNEFVRKIFFLNNEENITTHPFEIFLLVLFIYFYDLYYLIYFYIRAN